MTWHCGSISLLLRLTSSYHVTINCGYAKNESMSGIFIKLSLPKVDTIVHNSHISFVNIVNNLVTVSLIGFMF